MKNCEFFHINYRSLLYFPGKFDEVYAKLSNGASATKKFRVFKREQMPDRWHMKNSPRLSNLLYLLTEPGHIFWSEYFEEMLNQTSMFWPVPHRYSQLTID